jgi:hypothetical protein
MATSCPSLQALVLSAKVERGIAHIVLEAGGLRKVKDDPLNSFAKILITTDMT